jgi:subfamily B ATP-binding cassette protein MsbA
MIKLFVRHLPPRYLELIDLVKEQWIRLLLAMLFMLAMACANSAIPFLIKPVVDDIFIEKNSLMLTFLPLAVILVYMVLGTSMYFQEYLMNFVGKKIIQKLRNRLYNRITDLPISFFHHEKTGVLISRVTSDVNIINNMVSSMITGSLRDFFTIIGLTIVIFYRDWRMAIFALIVLPIAFFPIVALGKRIRKVTSGTQKAMGDLTTMLHETFSGNKIVKAFGMEEYEKTRFAKKTQNLFKLQMKTVRLKALSSPVMEFLGGLGVALVIWYGGMRVISGQSTAGTFFSFMAAVLMLYGPVKKISKLNNTLQEGLAGADRVFDILETTSKIKEISSPTILKRCSHNVCFEHVHFGYEEEMVLKDINLTASAGEILAIVGTSGGGKTSLVNLIPRFYDVSQGKVTIDDLDIRNLALKALRDQIAIVTQEPILFNDTVRNNIAYGNPDSDDEEIIAAAKSAFAYDFIERFPDKFETNIGELGARLSGGQKQRICIARALIKNAPILILDEATSALDTESEALVQKALENLMLGRTTFVIAHRLSTIEYAHRVVVLKDGRIIESGTQKELLAKSGEFHKLYQLQFKNDQPMPPT